MRSMWMILSGVVDGQINTKEQAAALLDEEARDYAEALHLDEETARRQLRSNIGYMSGYYAHAQADRIMELFDTEHPIFGRNHPSPEEAFQLGLELAKKYRPERLIP